MSDLLSEETYAIAELRCFLGRFRQPRTQPFILTLQLALDGLRRGGFRRRRKGRLDPGDLRPGKLGFRLEFAHLGLQQRPQLIRTLPLCAHLDQRAVALCDHLLQFARP
jgi:hypothetical protein